MPETMSNKTTSRKFDREALFGDLFGGLAATLVALPSAIAFGLVIYSPLGSASAGLGAMAGILGAIAIGLIAPAFGGSKRLVSAPCAPAAAVMGALVAELLKPGSHVEPQAVPALLGIVALISGGLQFLFGAIGGGRLIKYIPYPVVAGYMSGVGLLIIIGQLPKFLGLEKDVSLWQGIAAPSTWSVPSVGVALVAVAIMFSGAKLTRKIPVPILALAGGVLAYFVFASFKPELLSIGGNRLLIGPIGEGASFDLGAIVKSRIDGLAALTFDAAKALLMPTLTLSVLLSIDTLKTCVIVDALTRSRHDSNRELRGQGLGNIASALVGGMPGAGTMGATLVNLGSGGRTRRSGVFVGVFAALIFLVLGKLVAWVPVAALAGILIVVGFRMIDRQSFHLLKSRNTIFDFAVIAAVVLTAVSFNLMAAAGVGVLLAIALFLRDQIRGSVILHKGFASQTFSKRRRLPDEMNVLSASGEQVVIFKLQGSLFFGTTDQLFSELEPHLNPRRGSCKYVLFDMRRVRSIDFTATHMMEQIEAQIADQGGSLVLTNLPSGLPGGRDLKTYLGDLGLIHGKRAIHVFESFDEGLEWIEERLLEDAKVSVAHDRPPLGLSEIDVLSELPREALEALSFCVVERSFKPGEKIFSAGDVGDEIFLIRKGEVKIWLPLGRAGSLHLATFGRGDFFGDMAFLDKQTRSADAVASRAADLYVMSRGKFDELVASRPAIGAQVFEHLAHGLALRLRYTDAELRALEEF